MLRLFKAVRQAAGFSTDHSGNVCPSTGRRRKDFGKLPSGNRKSGTPGGELQARQVLDDDDLANWVIIVNRWPRDIMIWSSGEDFPLECGRTFLPWWGTETMQCSMRSELESRAKSFLKRREELEVSFFFAATGYALLENLGEPSLYKRAGVMRAVINLHPSPPPPTHISLSGRILKKQ